MSDYPGAHGSNLEEGTVTDEAFLFHLSRGSELLMQDRVVEAKEQLERALHFQPQDSKSQALLAGVYFRLGHYPRAIRIYSELVQAHPENATLHVNLALALLKTGQPAEALAHVRAAIQVQPEHPRAWGYLGVVYWRLGQFADARDAFLRGGQLSMARRMEEVIDTDAGRPATDSDAPEEEEVTAMRAAAERAIARFEAEAVPLEVEPSSSPGRPGDWRATEPGAERIPSRSRFPRAQDADAPPSLRDWVQSLADSVPAASTFAVTKGGALLVASQRAVFAKTEGLRFALRTQDLGIDETNSPWTRFQGPLRAAFDPPSDGGVFHVATLYDDVLYAVEDYVWAFDGSVRFESARFSRTTPPLSLVQLHGTGAIVLRLSAHPSATNVTHGQEVRVRPESLVGWTGRLIPWFDSADSDAPNNVLDGRLSLVLRGEGVLLVQ